jgi:hypothetical protein
MVSMDEGMQIDASDGQSQKRLSSRTETWLPLSNVTSERDAQPEKQLWPIVSIDEGIQIDRSNEQVQKQYWPIVSIGEGMQIDGSDEQLINAPSPRIDKRLPFSNVTLERPVQEEKQCREIVSTDEGMQIDSSAKQSENADS